ncbi:heparan-alpha-glucosaminide N-acetyltransferase [Proteinivorax tanatarense]|uniref:Heparan-alpha-glucosaminide N-acetyltransferase n=1 Tax=Proteinivorax tanatarense TaxID=1260629 RepID=A0AAU7VJ46_9FIRM
MKERIWELDFLRVLAIGLMITFHIVYDLNAFTEVNINLDGLWYWVGKVSALTFIVVSGISSGLGKNSIKRGISVFGYGMIITVVTYVLMPDNFVVFGILHLLGIGMILSPVFHKINKWALLILSLVLISLNLLVENILIDTPYFLAVGIRSYGFKSIDYYPLIPYLGVFMFGVFIYQIFYFKRKSAFKYSLNNKYITWISQNSLKIYLLHQPIILTFIYVFS